MATTNSKSFFDLSVTTQLFLLVGFLWKVQLLLIFNPLTLFVLNIFKPRWARTMAHSDALYDKNSQRFFDLQAKKWPWHWAKWWYTSEELKHLSEERQIEYYKNVNHSTQTLTAMSASAAAKVLDDDFTFFKECGTSIKMSSELFRVFIEKSLQLQDWSVFEDYLKGGTLPKELVVVLANAACHWSVVCCGWRNDFITGIFLDYVERCGLSNEMRQNIGHDKEMWCNADFEKELVKRLNIYDQRVFTKSQRGSKQIDAWISFCETTKEICPQAQMEMGLDQYHVFHETGHTLDAEAILHILKHYSNLTMAQLIFKYEPNYGMANDDIKEFVNNNPTLQDLLNAVICSCQDFLSKSIKAGERLDISFVIKMFECPKAEEFVMKYIKKHSLQNTIHDKLLSLDNAKEVIQLYVELYDNDEFTELDLDVRREAEKRGWIPEKKD